MKQKKRIVMLVILLRSCMHAYKHVGLNRFFIIRCKEELVDFLIKHGVLISIITCDKCNNDLNINKETLFFTTIDDL